MENESVSKESSDSLRPIWSYKLLIGSVILVGLTYAVRLIAQEWDNSVANVLTLILGFCTWLTATLGLARSQISRIWWRMLAAAPFVIMGVTLARYRVTGIDGELIPQFAPRWVARAQPPTEASNTANSHRSAGIAAEQLQPSAHDFPQFLGPNRNGVVAETQLETDWASHPPKVLWKQPIGAGWSGFAVQGNVAVTLEQRDKEQWISAYDVNSGQLYWHVALPGYHFNALGGAGPRSTPTIDNGRVYAQTATGQVVCLELGTGQQHWQVDLLKLGKWDQIQSELAISWGRSASPLVTESLVILPLGSPYKSKDEYKSQDETAADQPFGPDSTARSLVAFDKQNGQVVWRAGSHQISYSSPSRTKLLGVDQIVIVNETSVTGHDLSTGKVLWLVPWAGQSNGSASVSQTIAINDSQLLVSKGYSTGAMLVEFSKSDDGQWQPKQVWSKTSVLKTKFTSAVVKDEYAYALSDGVLECVRIADGVRQWKGGRYRHGQVLLVGDTLLISAEDGAVVLVAARPNKFTELARLEVLTGVTWNVPAISGDRLLMRNADQAACLKLPLRLP